jgi:dolichol-phosphate mannosyltransferase
MSRRVVEVIRAFPERTRYLRGLRTWVGFSQIGIEVERGPRASGKPKYSALKLFKLALDGIFAFSTLPIRAASVLGGLSVMASIAYAIFALWAKLTTDESPHGFTALIFAIVFLSGVQLLFLGIIGEYVGRVYQETKQRPLYVVARTVGIRNG